MSIEQVGKRGRVMAKHHPQSKVIGQSRFVVSLPLCLFVSLAKSHDGVLARLLNPSVFVYLGCSGSGRKKLKMDCRFVISLPFYSFHNSSTN